jgi:hypothetical protein
MKAKYAHFKNNKIALLALCLTFVPLCAISQVVTVPESTVQKIARDLQICEVATRELDLTRQFNSRLTRQLNDEIFAHQQTRLALDRVKRQATRNGWVAVGASAALLIQTLILLRP